jgi:hypothetical protein
MALSTTTTETTHSVAGGHPFPIDAQKPHDMFGFPFNWSDSKQGSGEPNCYCNKQSEIGVNLSKYVSSPTVMPLIRGYCWSQQQWWFGSYF